MSLSRFPTLVLLGVSLVPSGSLAYGQVPQGEPRTITTSTIRKGSVTLTDRYACRIHSRRHIKVQALEDAYLEAIAVKEGQAVKQGDLLFRIVPLKDGEKPVADNQATRVEIKAPFDGIIDGPLDKLGTLIQAGDPLATLSDNSVMWVYFKVPERRYLEYLSRPPQDKEITVIGLLLASGEKFPQPGKIGAMGQTNRETGAVNFRADFPNPDGLLRHGQAGTVTIKQVLKDVPVIPRRATFEERDRRYVYVVDRDDVAHRREVSIQGDGEDVFVEGVKVGDRIVSEGVGKVRDGEKVEKE